MRLNRKAIYVNSMKKKKFSVLVYCFFLLFTFPLLAQKQEQLIGKLVNAETNEPVAFATIRIKHMDLGVISNVDGSFKVPSLFKQSSDSIEITSIGYRTATIPITNLGLGKLNLLKLVPGTINRGDLNLHTDQKKRNFSAYTIVKMAIEAIRDNYPKNSFSAVGYYRDYQLKNDTYINLNEAILEIFDQGFDQVDFMTSEIRLYETRVNKDFERDIPALQKYDYRTGKKIVEKAYLEKYDGNGFTNLRIHDALRNFNDYSYDPIGRFEKDFLTNHRFSKNKDTFLGDEALYVIDGYDQQPSHLAHTKLYISKKDHAIYKIEYTLYNAAEKNLSGVKNKHGHKRKLLFDVVVEYTRIKEKMYLNYISFHTAFKLHLPPMFQMTESNAVLSKGYIGLKFNRPIDSVSARVKNNYALSFKGAKWDIDKIEVFKDSLHIYPLIEEQTMASAIDQIKVAESNNSLVGVRVQNLTDTEGNLIHTARNEIYKQFRELFVQRIKQESRAPFDDKFMNKRKPIFARQVLAPSPKQNDYWMNTPSREKTH